MKRLLLLLPNLKIISLRRDSLPALGLTELSKWWEKSNRQVFTSVVSERAAMLGQDTLLTQKDVENVLKERPYVTRLTEGVTLHLVVTDQSEELFTSIIPFLNQRFPYSRLAVHLIVQDLETTARLISDSIIDSACFWQSFIPYEQVTGQMLAETIEKGSGHSVKDIKEVTRIMMEQPKWRPMVIGERGDLGVKPGDIVLVDDRQEVLWTNEKINGALSLKEAVFRREPAFLAALRSHQIGHVVVTDTTMTNYAEALGGDHEDIGISTSWQTWRNLIEDEIKADVSNLIVGLATVSPIHDQKEDEAISESIKTALEAQWEVMVLGLPVSSRSQVYPLFKLPMSKDKSHYITAAANRSLLPEDVKRAIWQFAGLAKTDLDSRLAL